uniref:Uncharacterized protein n=1 Tax=Cyprinus carpio carpio TaxID=630221 RepID=A0A8C0YKN6_CYPCA
MAPNSTSLQLIGGNEGDRFWFTGECNGVKAVRAWLSDGCNKTFGEPVGEHTEFSIKFKTVKFREFFCENDKLGFKNGIPYQCWLWILSCMGNSGRDIDCMGFMFLNNIQSVVLCDVSYPTTEQVTPQVAVEEIKSVTYKKKTSVGQRQTVETTKKITKTNKWLMRFSFSCVWRCCC